MKKSLMTAMLARAAAVDAQDDRARFDQLVVWTQRSIDRYECSEDVWRYKDATRTFAEMVHLAKNRMGMTRDEFLTIVAPFNTDNTVVLDRCPAEKEMRTNIPDDLKMNDEEFRMNFDLTTPEDAADFIANRGALWGYGPVEVARATKEHLKFRAAYRAKQDAEDRVRADARSAEIKASQDAFRLKIQAMKAA